METTNLKRKNGRPAKNKMISISSMPNPVHIRTYEAGKYRKGNDYAVDVTKGYADVYMIVAAALDEGRVVTARKIEPADVLYTRCSTDTI